jgi:hypothetical protein
MKKLALAASLAAGLALMAPIAAGAAPASDRMQLAQADVTVKKTIRSDGSRKKVVIKHRGGDSVRRKVVIRHGDRGMHRGWDHSRHHGARTTTVIKHHGNKTVIKKKFEG